MTDISVYKDPLFVEWRDKMNLVYLKEHICEELDGAEEYINRAIEIKAMDPSWAKMFYEMSSQELAHAGYFYKMATDYYTKVTGAFSEPPEYMEECMETTTDIYTERTALIKNMHTMYSK